MSLPAPYANVDDRGVVDGCIGDDADAWQVLWERHGLLVESVVARVLDQRRPGNLEDMPAVVSAVRERLRRDRADLLRVWGRRCDLGHYLALISRQLTEAHVENATPVAPSLSSPSPAADFLDDLVGTEPVERITEVLDRHSPHVTAMVRLRLRDLDPEGIAAALGMPRHTVVSNLERIAVKLGRMQQGQEPAEPKGPSRTVAPGTPPSVDEASDDELATLAWRALLDCAPLAERTHVALRAARDPALRHAQTMAEGTWRAVRHRALNRPHAKSTDCLDEPSVAAFVDGSIRGTDRARAEGHLANCARCIDSVARLLLDIRALGALREARGLDRELALAAACLTTGRFRAAEGLARCSAARGGDRAGQLLRVIHVALALDGNQRRDPSYEPSRVMPAQLPTDDEAPLVGLEALCASDPHAAARAIDDHAAKSTIGARIRLLAAAAGHDLDEARRLAADIGARRRPDAGLRDDAEVVRALPDGSVVPHELLVDRLRDALGDAAQFALRLR